MTLAAGTKLGPYEIVSPIGAGGMGEVYRARDARLGRDVAIKVLPPAFVTDPDRLRRFEREARAAAALNHPNILSVFDVGTEDGQPYVVAELLDGGTLRERLGTPLSVAKAIDYAAQIASGLAAAHDKGIAHRDIKPENLFITRDGQVKILDFGVAKLKAAEPRGSDSATVATTGIGGLITGTPGYMSPEQAAGRDVDSRSDQFSLGATLYEMLTGRRAFQRDSAAQTLAAIIEDDPAAIETLCPRVPAPVRWLVERCLQKDPSDRFSSTQDLVRDLRGLTTHLTDPEAARASAAAARSFRPATALAVLAAMAIAAGAVWWLGQRGRDETIGPVSLTQITTAEGVEMFPAWSPDATRLAYSGESAGHRRIFVRTLATGEDRLLTTASADEIQPAWSPDGGVILFVRARDPQVKLEPGDVFGAYDGGDIWLMDMKTHVERRLIDNAYDPSFSPDGTSIAVDASWAGPRRIWTTDSRGRNPKQVSSDSSEAVSHVMPRWSPDGRAVVFQNIERTKFDIKVVSLASGASTWVTNDAILDLNPVWAPSGRDIYFSSQRGGGFNVWDMPVTADGAPSGPARQITTGAGQDLYIAPSPDGRRLALAILRQNADVWRLPVSAVTGAADGAPAAVIATSREDSRAAASPDGRYVAFNSDRAQSMNIWIHATADGADRQLTTGPGGDYQPNWSPDGAHVAFFSSRSGPPNIWSVEIATGTLAQLTHDSSVDINPFYSPNGRFIAYQSDRDGRLEVWVMRSDGGEARQLTHIGVLGHFLRWTPDSQRVIFRSIAAEPSGLVPLYSVSIDGGEPAPLRAVAGGSHLSFSPSQALIADVVGHKTLWITPMDPAAAPRKLFAFAEADARIDYPAWSPDGKWILFDRFKPEGGDIWVIAGLR